MVWGESCLPSQTDGELWGRRLRVLVPSLEDTRTLTRSLAAEDKHHFFLRDWQEKKTGKIARFYRYMRNWDLKSFKILWRETREFMQAGVITPIPRLLSTTGGFWPVALPCLWTVTYFYSILLEAAIIRSWHFIFPSNFFSLLYLWVSATLGGFIAPPCRGLGRWHIPAAQHLPAPRSRQRVYPIAPYGKLLCQRLSAG